MAEQCDVTVVETGGPDNGSNEAARRFREGEIDVTSVRDMVDKLIRHAEQKGCCIKRLTIIGHGYPGNQSVGDGQATEPGKHMDGNEHEWGPELDRLKPKLCPGAVVTLRGCAVGAEQAGADKLFALAKRLGCKVRGYTGACYEGNHPDGPGEWVEATPTSKPDAKPMPTPSPKKPKQGAQEDVPGLLYRKGRSLAVLPFGKLAGGTVVSRIPKGGRFKLGAPNARLIARAVERYAPIVAFAASFDIEAELRVKGAPASYLCGGCAYLVPGGDWTLAYYVGPTLKRRLARLVHPKRHRRG